MKKFKAVSVFCFLMIFFFSVTALAMPVPDVPASEDAFYAADYAGVLSDETKAEILSANQTLRAETGAEIVVCTVDFTDGQETSDYATDLGSRWGVGSKEYNNGMVLLLSIGDDDYFCAVGTGLNEFSGRVKTVLNADLEPFFADKQYDAGVKACFSSLVALINESGVGGPLEYYNDSGDYSFAGFRENASGFESSIGVGAGVFLVLVFLCIAAAVFSMIRSTRVFGRSRLPLFPFLFVRPRFFGFKNRFRGFDHHDDFHNFGGFSGGGFSGGGGGFSGGGGGSFSGGGAGRG